MNDYITKAEIEKILPKSKTELLIKNFILERYDKLYTKMKEEYDICTKFRRFTYPEF